MRVSRLFRSLLLIGFIVIGYSLSIAGGEHPWSENPNSSSEGITDSGTVRSNSTDPGSINNPGDILLREPSTFWMRFLQFLSVSPESRTTLSPITKENSTSESTAGNGVSGNCR
jgi:hypothetical protein